MSYLPTSGKLAAVALIAGAGLVWLRDTGWSADIADTLPLAAGIPLAAWLGAPWRAIASNHESQLPTAWPLLAGLAFAVAWILSSITLLALAWTALAGYWMLRYYKPRGADLIGLLLILALSFPWMVMEWPQIGWWFRLSAAVATEGFFHFLQMPVSRNGTELLVLGETIRIEPACAGWNLLQLTLLTGVTIGLHDISQRRRFLWFLALMPILAWLANFLRIVILSALSLSCGVATAEGVWHGLTGLLVIAVVIGLAKMLCGVIEPKRKTLSRRMVAS
jgi:exosortase/archaeosortase family protein